MESELMAASDVATGGLIRHAIDPTAAASGAHGHGQCLNCGTALAGDFCQACGQPQHIHKTLSSIGHDVLHGVFHFDGKIWRTLPMLFTRPGALTRRYIDGERVRFVSPLALFLFSVFLMVATFELVGGPFGPVQPTRDGKNLSPAELRREIAKESTHLSQLRIERARLKQADADTDSIDDKISRVEDDVAGLKTVQSINSGELPESMKSDNPKLTINTGSAALDKRVKEALKEPKLFLYKLQSSAYKFSWMLVPISLPFIWLLFAFRRDVGPYDHATFAIYSLSAMTLGVVALSMLRAIGLPGGIIAVILVLGPPLHMYKQLRGTYRLSRFGAAWRTIALLFSATIATLLFLLFVIGIAS